MIKEHDLQEAIAECQGKRNPDANTCIKLAAFYTIKEHLFPDAEKMVSQAPAYSYAAEPANRPPEPTVDFYGESEFAQLIDGRPQSEIWPLIEELVSAVQALQPRLYNGFIQQLQY